MRFGDSHFQRLLFYIFNCGFLLFPTFSACSFTFFVLFLYLLCPGPWGIVGNYGKLWEIVPRTCPKP